jgi:hypothetical protein
MNLAGGKRMSKDYSAIDGIIKQTRECVIEAYNKGYKDGYKDGQVVTQQAFDAEYQRGLKDAWKVARNACPILDNKCPYPWLKCEECEVYCVMERANKKLEERNYMP